MELGSHCEDLSTVKCFNSPTPSVVYDVDHSKAEVLALFLFCVALWFLLRGVYVDSCRALCSRVFSVLFGIVITSLGEEKAGLWSSRTFCTR